MTLEDIEHRLDRVESQHADYVRVLSSHTAAMAGHTATLSTLVGQVAVLQQTVGQIVGEVVELRRVSDQRQALADQRHAEIMAQFEKLLDRPRDN
jgi:hypothetical protein